MGFVTNRGGRPRGDRPYATTVVVVHCISWRAIMPTSDDSERHRRSPRLRGYDYALAGAYFVTICTQERMPCFGRVANDLMHLSPAGLMVQEVWAALPTHYPGIDLDVC